MSRVWNVKIDVKPSVIAVKRLFAQTDWTNERDDESIAKMIENTSLCFAVYEEESLVGFARVLTDFVYRAFIEDVIVDNSYKGLGIGSSIVKSIIARLDMVDEVCLACSQQNVTYYERFGFKKVGHANMHVQIVAAKSTHTGDRQDSTCHS